jgi:hypothetical protein
MGAGPIPHPRSNCDFETLITFLHVRKETSSGIPRARAKHFVGMMRRMFQRHVPDRCTTRYLVEDGDPASTIISVETTNA